MEGSVAVPMLVGTTLRGVLGVAKPVPYEFSEAETGLLLEVASAIGECFARVDGSAAPVRDTETGLPSATGPALPIVAVGATFVAVIVRETAAERPSLSVAVRDTT